MKRLLFVLAVMFSFITVSVAQSADYKLRQAYSYINQEQYFQAAKLIRPLADGGNAEAQYLAARMFLEGKGVMKSEAQFLKYAKLSAQKGYVDAMALIGAYYETKKDYASALTWLKKAVAGGHAGSYGNIGLFYFNGWGVKADKEEAFLNFTMGADKGDGWCMGMLSKMYFRGLGCETNSEKSLEWADKSLAKYDNVELSLLKSVLLGYEEHGIYDEKKALDILKGIESEAADIGSPYYLERGIYSLRGKGGVPADTLQALVYFRKALEMKDAGSGDSYWWYSASEPEIWLADFYANGWGVRQDRTKAIGYYKKAGKQAYPQIALMYLDGLGVPKDEAEALKYCKAYEEDSAPSSTYSNARYAFVMGCLHLSGKVIEQDDAKAEVYLSAAVDMGFDRAYDLYNHVRWKRVEHEMKAAGFNDILEYADSYYAKKEYDKAVDLYRIGMSQGNLIAQACLALCIKRGEGAEKNLTQAYVLMKGAAEKGCVLAMGSLARMYWEGTGCQKSRSKAKEWACKGAEAGDPLSKKLWEEYRLYVEVGDYAHGGVVCYVDASGKHGLVVTKMRCSARTLQSAMSWAAAYSSDGNSDWFLPSVDDAKYIMEVKTQLRVQGTWHWTSTRAGQESYYCWGPNPYFRTMTTMPHQSHPAFAMSRF